MSTVAPKPWYADGLRFECHPDCGACCSNHGDYSYVYLEGEDADRLATHLGLPREEFLARHTVLDEGHVVLRMDEPACPFLDGTRCTVYDARPTQCKTFPFWPETLRSRKTWTALRRFCPGIDAGPHHSLEAIQGVRSRISASAANESPRGGSPGSQSGNGFERT